MGDDANILFNASFFQLFSRMLRQDHQPVRKEYICFIHQHAEQIAFTQMRGYIMNHLYYFNFPRQQ